jgi:hypothetical protein
VADAHIIGARGHTSNNGFSKGPQNHPAVSEFPPDAIGRRNAAFLLAFSGFLGIFRDYRASADVAGVADSALSISVLGRFLPLPSKSELERRADYSVFYGQ